jgi:glycosyltransferase involved in cell wall biosynthesis
VCFDPQTFLRQRTGGISRLFTDLVRSFSADPSLGVTAEVSLRLSNNAYLGADLADLGYRTTPGWLPRSVLYGPWWLRGAHYPKTADLVHHTYYSRRFLDPGSSRPQVTTVYDMIPELFAGTEGFTASHLQKREYVAHCDLVICISESTKQDMLDRFGRPRGRVVVVPSAVGPGFSPDLPPLATLPRDYLLYVGKRAGYKDFALLPSAMAQLRSRGIDIPVVVVGPSFTRDEEGELARLGISSVFMNRALDDAALKQAYAHCTALVQTSRYEGFGMTPLEAMASGAATVIANASSMPEVGGDVARYFEPGDAESLAESLEALLVDDRARGELGARGIERARLFTARRMAERTVEAYRETLGL